MTSEIRFSGVGAKPQGWDAYVAGYCKLFGDNTLTKNTNKTESLMIGIGYFVVGIVICIFVFLTLHKIMSILYPTHITSYLYHITEVLSRSTSVKDALDLLRSGTDLWKVRNKGQARGYQWYKRKYRLDLADLVIKYSPHHGSRKNISNSACVKGNLKIDLFL